MSERKKFTPEELNEIKELRDANSQKISEFGQLELELLLAGQRVESLLKAKEELQKSYVDLQDKETELVKNLNEKYGAGTVDINSGEFVPTN
jgi:tmRNA-binding protein